MPAENLSEQLTKYLTDVHSIEQQALAQMRQAPKIAGHPDLSRIYAQHLTETEEHERLVRGQLERRDAEPSKVKDAAGRAGGWGMILFARLNPDTPGKLAMHAHSYEHMELAAYELLRRIAERAGDEPVRAMAESIAGQERAMADRLAERWDEAVAASLREKGAEDLSGDVVKYLRDAHALEAQAAQMLETGPKLAEFDALATVFREHLQQTREHQRLVEERLGELDSGPSRFQSGMMRLGALNLGTFFRRSPTRRRSSPASPMPSRRWRSAPTSCSRARRGGRATRRRPRSRSGSCPRSAWPPSGSPARGMPPWTPRSRSRASRARRVRRNGRRDRAGRGPSRAPHVPEGNPGGISEGPRGDPAKRPRPDPGMSVFRRPLLGRGPRQELVDDAARPPRVHAQALRQLVGEAQPARVPARALCGRQARERGVDGGLGEAEPGGERARSGQRPARRRGVRRVGPRDVREGGAQAGGACADLAREPAEARPPAPAPVLPRGRERPAHAPGRRACGARERHGEGVARVGADGVERGVHARGRHAELARERVVECGRRRGRRREAEPLGDARDDRPRAAARLVFVARYDRLRGPAPFSSVARGQPARDDERHDDERGAHAPDASARPPPRARARAGGGAR